MFDISELCRYSSSVRRRFLEKLESLSWDEVTKNREASFYSMRNILIHMIDNEDWIVNWVIHGKSREYKRKKAEEYTSIQMIKNHLEDVEGRTKAYLAGAGEDELRRRVDLVLLSSGASFDLSVEEALFQSFTEQLYHMGELIALLWQEDIEPPKMQYFYNR
ncbi:MAG: hypothetical protein JRM91_01745 [Nitrososphaerota archaeon]|jgi:uncharacterized damage-inducible protein DinB|nr:hypothetical protein [Nitrososphaerota archaeon]MDG6945379.1 hypothetical protein [Nitrososphaerota archaeon]MDG6949121.1 hypothetical protein [Nitrososphaerota archaeon]